MKESAVLRAKTWAYLVFDAKNHIKITTKI